MLIRTIARQAKRLSLCFVVWLWCFSFNVFAQTASCNKPVVYFINGVNTSPSGASDNSYELTKAIKERYPQYGVKVETIYNPMDGIFGDLAEVALTQDWLQSTLEFIGRMNLASGVDYSTYMQLEIAEKDAAKLRKRKVIDDIKDKVITRIKNDSSPVILIAHSQGNIMVNEAVIELKTDPVTAQIPGIQTIAVLGIAVADTQNLGIIDTLKNNSQLYRYITSDDDTLMNRLVGQLKANFRQTSLPGSHPDDPTGHLIVDSYLSRLNFGFYTNSTTSSNARKIVVDLFDELYRNAAQAWPCFTLSSTPNPAAVDQEVVFSVTAKGRLSGKELAGQAVSLIFGDVTSPTLICSATLDSAGNASCRQTFLAPARMEKARISYKAPALPGFVSDPYSHSILDRTPNIVGVTDAIKITSVSCELGKNFDGIEDVTFWTVGGTATSKITGSHIRVSSLTTEDVTTSNAPLTICRDWTERFSYSNSQFQGWCARALRDPDMTTWSATLTSTRLSPSKMRAQLFHGVEGTITPAISCPGSVTYP